MKMLLHNILFLLLISVALPTRNTAQQVSVSEDINLRGDYAYEILRPIKGDILLYRDKGLSKYVTAYDSTLEYKWERELKFDKKKTYVIGLSAQTDNFNVFHSFRKDGRDLIKVTQYDEGANIIDSLTLLDSKESLSRKSYEIVLSENRKKTLLYYVESNSEVKLLVIDNDSLWLDWSTKITMEEEHFRRDLEDVILTNDGEIYFGMVENHSRYKKDNRTINVVRFRNRQDSIKQALFKLEDLYTQGIIFQYDNLNHQFGIYGLYGKKKSHIAEGYFMHRSNFNQVETSPEMKLRSFSEAFVKKVYSKESKKKQGLENYKAVETILKKDGGVILVTEMQKRYSRRAPINGVSVASNSNYNLRGWNDYYNEDMLLISIHPDGKEHWKKMLYKKQFSQDDNSIYSSFYSFRTPSRIKIIFNDQIRNNNTVSEYILNGIGNLKRESVFSTEHQKLKLRIKDAIQISSTEMIIPSERSNNLNIVKISYP